MVDRVFKTILFFTPIAYCIGVDYWKFEIVFFQLSSIILFISALNGIPKREFNIKKLISIFLGICLFSTIVNGYQIKSLSAMINIFIGIVDIAILSIYCVDLKKCLNWLMIGLGINTVVFIGQMFGYSPFIDPSTFIGGNGQVIIGQFGGIIGNSPRFAAFIALMLPFVSRWYLIPALILGLFLNEASILFSIFCVSLYTIYTINNDMLNPNQYSVLFISLLFAGLASIFFFREHISQSFSIRFSMWRDVISNLAQQPFNGFGLGVFPLADYAASSFLQWIYGVGVLGVGFITLCIKRIKWYMLPLIFLCLFEYPFEIPRLWPLIIFIIAYYAIEQKEDYYVKTCSV